MTMALATSGTSGQRTGLHDGAVPDHAPVAVHTEEQHRFLDEKVNLNFVGLCLLK